MRKKSVVLWARISFILAAVYFVYIAFALSRDTLATAMSTAVSLVGWLLAFIVLFFPTYWLAFRRK